MPVNIQFRRSWEEVEQDRPRDRTLEYVQQQKSQDEVTKAVVSAVFGVVLTIILAMLAFAVVGSIIGAIRANTNKTSFIPPAPQASITSTSPSTVSPPRREAEKLPTYERITFDSSFDEKTWEPPCPKTDSSPPLPMPQKTKPVRAEKPGGTYAYVWPAPEGASTYTYWDPRPSARQGGATSRERATASRRRGW